MIELSELKQDFIRNDVKKIIAAIDEQPGLINHVFEEYRSRSNLLQMAVPRNNPELVRILLDRGASPIAEEGFTDNLIHKLLSSARRDRIPSIEILQGLLNIGIEFPLKDENSCRSFIFNTLQGIFDNDHIDTLKAIIELGFDPAAVEQSARVSMIARAIENRYEESCQVAELLLEMGCSVEALEKDDVSPLGKAVEMKLYPLAASLLEKAFPGKAGNLIHELARDPDMPSELLQRLSKDQDLCRTDNDGMTPILCAVANGNTNFVSHLVNHRVDINLNSDYGTPLMYAITCKDKKMIKHLMELGADLNVIHDKFGSALDMAQSSPGFKQICSAMIKAGAKTTIESSAGEDQQVNIVMGIERAIQAGEAWANTARDALVKADANEAILWNTLLRHCLDNNSAKPSKKWLKDAGMLVEDIGAEKVRLCLLEWFPLIKEKRVAELDADEYDEYCYGTQHVISENNTRLLKGLIWISSQFDDSEMSRSLRELATHMYKKVYGVGMRNAKLANAALYSLSIMPGTVGLKEIIVLRAATKYNPALVNINRVFHKLAEESGKTPDELEELSTPDYGLTELGKFRQQVGEFEAVATLISVGKCELVWVKDDKAQKSVPAAIKTEFADDIKAIKASIKDVQTGCSAHSLRLEQMYLRRKTLNYDTWKEQYVDHRLIGFLARRLIWRISSGDTSVNVIHSESGYIDHAEAPTEIATDAMIELWHPSMSAPEETLAFRTLLIDRQITQPFKQAHREIYLLTDAERTTRDHSLRFANHILKHSQFHALATQRGWSQQRGGQWDGGSENSANKHLPAFKLNVNFEAEGAETYGLGNMGIYECVATGEVSFSSGQRVALETVDTLLFSEVMRDVDLFVSVTSIGNDPDWRERENTYWQDSSFGELTATAATRKEVLEVLIPRLKVANQLKIDGRFLMVEGHLTTYKIHLGSSNILMAPNDRYLCIVETRSKSSVMLPFEGDRTLSLILSKATMLANDNKIKDQTILSQIKTVASE